MHYIAVNGSKIYNRVLNSKWLRDIIYNGLSVGNILV